MYLLKDTCEGWGVAYFLRLYGVDQLQVVSTVRLEAAAWQKLSAESTEQIRSLDGWNDSMDYDFESSRTNDTTSRANICPCAWRQAPTVWLVDPWMTKLDADVCVTRRPRDSISEF